MDGECAGNPFKGGTAEVIRRWIENIKARGGELLTNTRVTKLIMTDGRVTGVEATTKSGDKLIIHAKKVIIATGGAGRMHYQGFPTSNHYGATADGLVLAAPVYWYTFPAQIKHVIDRFVSLYNAKKFPAGIPAALITCCAEPAMDTFDGIVFAYRKTVSLLGCRNVGEVLIPGVYGAGEISQTDGLAQARALADKLCPTV